MNWRDPILLGGGELEGSWPNYTLRDGTSRVADAQGILSLPYEADEASRFHDKMESGTSIRSLQHEPCNLVHWESPHYKEALRRFLKSLDPSQCLIADIGCGDGRFTMELLELGFERVVAIDIAHASLCTLGRDAREAGYDDRLLLIQASAEHLPLAPGCLDAAIAMQSLYYLNERYESALAGIHRVLKEGATFIDTEPDLEGALFKSLFFEGPAGYEAILRDRRFPEKVAGELSYFRIFEAEELVELHTKAGFRVTDKQPVTILPFLAHASLLRREPEARQSLETSQLVAEASQRLQAAPGPANHIVWKSLREGP